MAVPTDLRQAAIHRINELWGTHEYEDRTADIDTRCTAFVVDPRFVRAGCGAEFRLGVSFGDNPYTEAMTGGFLPPPVLPGTHVYGIHTVGTRGNRIAMLDQWCDAREAAGPDGIEAAERQAREILASIPDDEYARMAGETPSGAEVFRSAERPIEEFEICSGESL